MLCYINFFRLHLKKLFVCNNQGITSPFFYFPFNDFYFFKKLLPNIAIIQLSLSLTFCIKFEMSHFTFR